MDKRINLYRGLFQKPKAAPKKIKLGFHAVVIIAFFVLNAIGMVMTFLGHKRTQNELKAKVVGLEVETQKVIVETNQLADIQIRKKKGATGDRIRLGRDQRSVASAGAAIDPTWSALLWRLSAITGGDIQLQALDLNVGGKGSAIVSGRTILMSGSATSLISMKQWLSRMTKELPGYDFSIDSQSIAESSAQNKFPVVFKITARLI